MPDATSEEFRPEAEHLIVHLPPEQKNVEKMGGTMRLGAWDCELKPGSKAYEIYQNHTVKERHRHRYEMNNEYLEQFEKHGFIASGINQKENLIEIMELQDHPWFIGVQFHPELKSTVENPHPLFRSFIEAALIYKNRGNHNSLSAATQEKADA